MRLTIRILGLDLIDTGPTDRYMGFTNGRENDE